MSGYLFQAEDCNCSFAEVAELVARCPELLHLDLADNALVSDALWDEPALSRLPAG